MRSGTEPPELDVLRFPFPSGLDLTTSPSSDAVVVRPSVPFTFFDQALVDERIQVRVEQAVLDILLVVVFEFVLDREAVWLILSGDRVQEVTLKSCQVVYQSAVW